MTVRIALVDDQAMLRMGFRMVLEAQPDMEVVGEASDGEEAIALVERVAVDVVLMDVRMPNLDGVAATAQITKMANPPRVLILTTFDLDEYVYAGLRAGASGFLLKDVPPDGLLHAIRVLAAGDAVVAPAVTRRLLDKFAHRLPAEDSAGPGIDLLTERERQVLLEMARGLSNAEIAKRLYLSEATVKTHVAHILMKLGLRDRVQAVVFAYETGLITPSAR
ncbi:MAG: two component transcriptional regulator, LuxR family [Actinomycetia bacterium]|nr:two component transcriptional regulator, LuxR family [Actinomycetes bacterium]